MGINFGVVQSILTDILGMSKVSADYQKRARLDISRFILSRYEDFIEQVVTQDESWVHHFDPESKMQSKQWKHPGSHPPKKFKRVHSAGKMMASIFWDSQGVIIFDYLEQGRTIKGAYYAGKLRWLRQEIGRKRRGKLTRSILLLQYNAPAHMSQVAMTTATECGFEILPHHPYSPDMATSDFYLFPKLKSHLHGTQYRSNEGVKEAANEYFGDQEKAFYFEGIRKLEQRWA